MSRPLGYATVSLRALNAEIPPVCDLYIKQNGKHVLYRSASLPFTSRDRERLSASGVFSVWVRVGLDTQSQQQLMDLLSLPDSQMPIAAKAELLNSSALVIAERALANPIPQEALPEIHSLIGVTVGFLARSRAAFPALQSIMHHDFSVYSHTVNVAAYALGLARHAGVTSEKDLENLGIGAVLHDVGKIAVPKEVLNKPGPLSSEEWRIVRQHPPTGLQMLRSAEDLPKVVLDIVTQHHERPDGSGYPYGLTGGSLNEFAVIVALVDAYDAMTSHRPYRHVNTPYKALVELKRQVGRWLDPALFTDLVHLLGGIY